MCCDDLRAASVDNLTGIEPSATRMSAGSHEYIGEIVQKLVALSMPERGVAAPVLLMCHLTRGDKLNAGKRPTAQDLAGSDRINRWANAIVLLHEKPEAAAMAGAVSSPGKSASPAVRCVGAFGETFTVGKGEVWSRADVGNSDGDCSHEVIVPKNRGGRRFICDLDFIGPQMRFIDPKVRTVRPLEMPAPEPASRTEFRRRMLELGDL